MRRRPLSAMGRRTAALFDMDRTLVRVNTGRLYAWWRFEQKQAGLRDLARFGRWLAEYSLGVIDPSEITTRALATLEGIEETAFRTELHRWYEQRVRRHVSAEARAEVERQRAAGRVLAILTASTPYAAGPLAAELGIEHVICTQLEVVDGRFTGRCAELCYGDGKVRMAEEWARRHGVDLDRSTFYTDSVSDLPMLKRVGNQRVVNPDPRLRWAARRRGWPVARWR